MTRYELELKEKEITDQIAKILADHRNLNWDHPSSRYGCQSDAIDIVSAWSKQTRSPQTEIEELCASIMEARAAFRAALAERQAVWAALRETRDAKLTPEPETFTVLTFKDETTGKRVRLSVPTTQVEWL